MRAVLTACLAAAALPVAAGSFEIGLPVDCSLGEDCYIQQYMDHDASSEAQDYRCQSLSYDGHNGTDFALPTLAELSRDVDVIAVAPGIVAGIRNNMVDEIYDPANADATRGRECGNGLVIDHGGGWVSQYCHLRRGSVIVETGTRVGAGTPLGKVGLSGRTQFPHVHLSIRKDGAPVDPFDPDGVIACGSPSSDTLWKNAPTYQPGGLLDVGFATRVPDYSEIKAGRVEDVISSTSPALVIFAFAFGGRAGDTIRLVINGPGGEVIRQEVTLEKSQAQFFRAAGRRAKADGWPVGAYAGTAELLRDGQVLDSRKAVISIP